MLIISTFLDRRAQNLCKKPSCAIAFQHTNKQVCLWRTQFPTDHKSTGHALTEVGACHALPQTETRTCHLLNSRGEGHDRICKKKAASDPFCGSESNADWSIGESWGRPRFPVIGGRRWMTITLIKLRVTCVQMGQTAFTSRTISLGFSSRARWEPAAPATAPLRNQAARNTNAELCWMSVSVKINQKEKPMKMSFVCCANELECLLVCDAVSEDRWHMEQFSQHSLLQVKLVCQKNSWRPILGTPSRNQHPCPRKSNTTFHVTLSIVCFTPDHIWQYPSRTSPAECESHTGVVIHATVMFAQPDERAGLYAAEARVNEKGPCATTISCLSAFERH